MKLRIVGFILSFGLNASACAPGPMPVSQSPRDPSSPAAPEGVPPLSILASAAAPNLGPRSPDDSGHGSVVYVCPMHPEVTSSSPGRCPKCGMDLVPKK